MKNVRLSIRLLLIGALLPAATTRAQTADSGHGHRSHPPMPDQKLYFHYQIEGETDSTPVAVRLEIPSPTTPADFAQVVEPPAPWSPLRLVRYLPRAALHQDVIPVEKPEAPSAVRISIDGPKLSYQRWLVADDPKRNRLVSLIGTWRYMSVANEEQRDELFRQFETELTRVPRLRVSRPDGSESHELEAQVGVVHEIDPLDCKLTTLDFYPHFAFDKENNQPRNKSAKRLNPAVLVRLEHDGQKEERWVFANYPEFQAQAGESLPYRITLDCALDKQRPTPDYVLLTINRDTHEAWERNDGKVSSRPITVNDRVDVTGSRYRFHLARFVPAGRLTEEYRPAQERDSVPALQIETTNSSGDRSSIWLELGRRHGISTGQRGLTVWFGPRQVAPAQRHQPTP